MAPDRTLADAGPQPDAPAGDPEPVPVESPPPAPAEPPGPGEPAAAPAPAGSAARSRPDPAPAPPPPPVASQPAPSAPEPAAPPGEQVRSPLTVGTGFAFGVIREIVDSVGAVGRTFAEITPRDLQDLTEPVAGVVPILLALLGAFLILQRGIGRGLGHVPMVVAGRDVNVRA